MSEPHLSVQNAPFMPPRSLSTRARSKDFGEGAGFYYQTGHRALKDINLSVADRCVTAFIGPSGCGKSTLLRVLNRIYDLYPGQRATGESMSTARTSWRPL